MALAIELRLSNRWSSGPAKRGAGTAWAALLVALALSFGMAVKEARAAPADAFSAFKAGSVATIDHSAWTALLAKHVRPDATGVNRVDYKSFKAGDHAALKAYVRALEGADVAALDRQEQFAFWANLYNAKTIDIILDHYPVASIKDISLGGTLLASFTGGPWKAKVLKVGSQSLSLDDIEHGILRPIFKDPRVHYAVNCASIGCPNLGTEAWSGARLGEQLDAAARAYVNHPRGVSVTGGNVVASSIYSWFAADFGGDEAGVLKHLRRYAADDLAKKLKDAASISDYEYDWSLNDTAAR